MRSASRPRPPSPGAPLCAPQLGPHIPGKARRPKAAAWPALGAMAALVALALAATTAPASAAFGEPAPARFTQFTAPDGLPGRDQAGEPSIGIPWATDHVFMQSGESTYRIEFANSTADNGTEQQPVWSDVTPPASRVNFDPMLHADPVTGRVWAGGLLTACSQMSLSDDGGQTWIPAGNMCTGYAVDHQTIGSGPYAIAAAGAAYPRATYYCAHGQAISLGGITDTVFGTVSPTACITSVDGGLTWGPPVPWRGGCGSLHGHVRVSPVTGFAAVPDRQCGSEVGFAYSQDNGVTWLSRTVAGSVPAEQSFDPSVAFGAGQGWLWFAHADTTGAHIALSKDQGVTWEGLGSSHGSNATWFDVGALHDPPIVRAVFADVQAGDDDRVAFSFLGVEDMEGLPDVHQCSDRQQDIVWRYYIALSYDGGASWQVMRMGDDPVQVGGISAAGTFGDPSCRNLLDFNDMDIDSSGRIHVGFADGCVDACGDEPGPGPGYRAQRAALWRQTDGRGLIAQYDRPAPEPTAGPTTGPGASEGTPGVPAILLASVLVAAAAAARTRARRP